VGIAAYNRGSASVARDADGRMPAAQTQAERHALKDEVARLRDRLAQSERDLRRASRCLAAERMGREALRLRLAQSEASHRFAIAILCRRLGRAGVRGFAAEAEASP